MSFASDLRRFEMKVGATTQAIFVGVVAQVERSVVSGSEITGAPGQPVDTGALRASWQTVYESPTRAIVGTNIKYAQPVEDGIGPHGPRSYGKSGTGGSHSVKMTVAGFDKIVAVETRKAVR